MTFSSLKQGEHFILPPCYFRVKHNRIIKKQKKKCWRDEKKRLSRAIDSGIILDPVCHGAFRKSCKVQIGRLKSMIRNHNNEMADASDSGPLTVEHLRSGALKGSIQKSECLEMWAELEKWEEESRLIINKYWSPTVKLIGMTEDT